MRLRLETAGEGGRTEKRRRLLVALIPDAVRLVTLSSASSSCLDSLLDTRSDNAM